MNKRRLAILSLALCLVLSVPLTSLAAGAKVSVAPGVTGVPAAVITDLENEYDPEETVILLSVSGMAEAGEPPEDAAQPAADQTDSPSEPDRKTQPVYYAAFLYSDAVTAAEQAYIPCKDEFFYSCAKGETAFLADTYTGSIAGSVAGNASADALGLPGPLQITIPAGTILTGPPEESSANSREYRVRYYQSMGTFSVRRVCVYYPGLKETLTGSWTAPAFCITYCIDRYIP